LTGTIYLALRKVLPEIQPNDFTVIEEEYYYLSSNLFRKRCLDSRKRCFNRLSASKVQEKLQDHACDFYSCWGYFTGIWKGYLFV